jgi:hypothetical protein
MDDVGPMTRDRSLEAATRQCQNGAEVVLHAPRGIISPVGPMEDRPFDVAASNSRRKRLEIDDLDAEPGELVGELDYRPLCSAARRIVTVGVHHQHTHDSASLLGLIRRPAPEGWDEASLPVVFIGLIEPRAGAPTGSSL